VKSEIRVLGIDDSPFSVKSKKVLVVATFFRGGKILDGILSTKITKDGSDSTKKLIKMIDKSKFKSQLQAILLDGITLGGFNIIDINKLYDCINIPVIVVMRKYPDKQKIYTVLKRIDQEKKFALIKNAGEIYSLNKIYLQFIGTDFQTVKKIIEITTSNGIIPEPIRLAHIIASGIIKGESYGGA
jgi:uncharacterized protein